MDASHVQRLMMSQTVGSYRVAWHLLTWLSDLTGRPASELVRELDARLYRSDD